jgi:hypothetical protein
MPVKTDREYRYLNNFGTTENEPYVVRGYASTFEPYTLFEVDGTEYKERVEPGAFAGADMRDVVFLFNHEGQVMARSKNGTLEVGEDEKGLWIRADLGSTSRSKEMYDEIRSGLIDQMSFAFTVAPDGERYDRDAHTRVITRVKKIYDVSAVTYPANPDTTISARSFFDGEIKKELEERQAAEERERRIRVLKLKLEVGK